MEKLIITLYRLFKYKAEWSKQFREITIRRQQKASLRKIDPKSEQLIIFLIPGADYFLGKENITGGLISIISLAQETAKIFKGTDTKTLCATYYNDHLIYKITSFENQTDVLRTELIEHYFENVKSLILHIPELYVNDFVLKQNENNWLKRIPSVHINILNQNIQLMPENTVLLALKNRFSICTITTAHNKYCNSNLRGIYGTPLHKLSVWISPEKYQKLNFQEKDNLILFSPDNKELTEKLIFSLKSKLPQFSFQIITGFKYEEYKEIVAKAKFIITTGEGLDAYFIETFFSGGIAFALKNLNFFDEKYLDLPCLFEEKENLEEHFLRLIEEFNDSINYNLLNDKVSVLLGEDYSFANYQSNLRKFYNKDYTHA